MILFFTVFAFIYFYLFSGKAPHNHEKMMTADDGDKCSATTSTTFGPHQKQAKLIAAAATATQSKVNALILTF